MAVKLGIFRRVSLEGVSEGWTDEAYILFRPMRLEHIKFIEELDVKTDNQELSKDKVEATQKLEDIFVSLFVKGKVFDEDMKIVDAEADHVRELLLLAVDKFMSGMLRGATDPKSQTQLETSSSTMPKTKTSRSK